MRLSEGQQSGWLDGLFASHPPSMERVEANRKTAAELGDKGEYRKDEYLAAIKPLLDSKEAYAAFDNAMQAYTKDDMKTARSFVNQAIHAEPREARFQALLGDINARGKRYDDALSAYTRAINSNPQYFPAYLGRGLVRQRVNKLDLAAADLQKSIELLPTATAHNALGQIEQKRGHTDQATEHFRIAAGSRLNPPTVVFGWVLMTAALLGLALYLRKRYGRAGYGYGILLVLLMAVGLVLLIIGICSR